MMRAARTRKGHAAALLLASAACAPRPASSAPAPNQADTTAIVTLARMLSADSFQGRGPWTPENEQVARLLADSLTRLGARPLVGSSVLVPFETPDRPGDTVFNVVGVLPSRDGAVTSGLIGITAHLDHLGIGPPDARGDSIYNGFLDDAIGIAMVMEVARRYAREPGNRALVVMYFNLEEQGLLGSLAFAARPEAGAMAARMRLLLGVDAGAPAGEATEWQLMGGSPVHDGTRIADSLARVHGWTTTATSARPISDVFPFAQLGVPILFPIPGKTWRGYSEAERDAAMARFDHYHQPSDEWQADFPLAGTGAFAAWLWEIVRIAAAR